MADDKLMEAVARLIDPSSWRVMDSYLEQTKRKYHGQNVGWPADQFQHKESMAIARAIIPLVQQAERADVVKWLRDRDYWTWRNTDGLTREDYANAIECGEHKQESQ